MLVLTPVPAHIGAYASRRPTTTLYSEIDYYDTVAEQAAQDYAAARARLRAIEQRREQSRQQQYYLEEASRRQAALDSYYREQSRLIAASIRTSSYAPARRSSTCAIEELGYSVRRDEERRRVLLARQRELERAQALADAKRRQEAERIEQARLQAQWAKQGEALLALLGLSAVASEDATIAQEHLSRSAQQSPTFPFAPATTSKPVDKGKGKAMDIPSQPQPTAPSRSAQPPIETPSFKEELEARLRASAPAPSSSSPAPEVPKDEGAHLHRAHALPPAVAEKLLKFYRARRARKLSLAQIKDVEDALRKLESTFEFPEHLDFVDPVSEDADADAEEPGALAYTTNNTPVHAYEHALNGLLTKLDAVESNGDLAVRGRRKEVVREVERALEAVERRVEESRERERERSRERRRSRSSSPVASATPSDVEEDTTQADQDSAVVVAPSAAPVAEAPEADTVSVALVDTAPPADITPDTSLTQLPASSIGPEPDMVPVALVEVPELANDSSLAASADRPLLIPTDVVSTDLVDAPEPDTVSVSLVDLSATEVPEPHSEDSPSDEAVVAEDSSSRTEQEPQAQSPIQSAAAVDSDVSSLTSPVAPSEPSDATFVTAPSTAPSTSVPTPEAITRETSTTTDATFVTADLVDSPIGVSSDADAAPTLQPVTRVPSEVSSAAEEAFLLSSSPLADEPKKSRPEGPREEDELEIIDKEEVAVKSDSEWSDVDAA
ncbi:hypothetical protein C8Q73DRAFT_715058 [Cubamyces lactineus]|nr:hypothetical protein C8Q73DRAFT_715058 [Cubamyces lactineus]